MQPLLPIPSPVNPFPHLVEIMDAAVRADLETVRSSYFVWLLICTGIVFIGLVLEIGEIRHDVISFVKRRKIEWEYEAAPTLTRKEREPSHTVKTFAAVGWLLIVIGVAGEGYFEGFVSWADTELQTFNNTLLADAQRETELAKERAGGAYERASANEKEAAQLRKDAEDERLARVEIEQRVAWRHLTEGQRRIMGLALMRFGPRPAASLWFNTSSTEAEMFADDIAEALKAARIYVQPPSGMMEMRESSRFGDPISKPDTGVIIQSTEDKISRELAESLVKELNDRGFDAERQKSPPFGKSSIQQIWVNVEPRPEGPQGEYKLQAERDAKAKKAAKTK